MTYRRLSVIVCLSLASTLLFLAAKQRAVPQSSNLPELHLDRSFAISDEEVLSGFPFERVLNALVETSGVPGMTAEKLFRQWMDTQNAKPGLDATMPHCDDVVIDGQPSLNGFPIACPTSEGLYATKPFEPEKFIPILITNRFDQAAPDGSHCGQYRIVYADSTKTEGQVFHIIFEGALPNPRPETGLAGCRPVAQFWADLSLIPSRNGRRERMEQFFFHGLQDFRPAIHYDHYHRAPAGIRFLQFTEPEFLAHFFQFRLVRECDDGNCRLFMKRDTLENVPFGKYFDARIDTPQARRFRDDFVANIKNLVIPDVNRYFIKLPEEHLVGDTHPSPFDFSAFVYGVSFNPALESPEGQAFRDRIAQEIANNGSTLTVRDVLTRAETENCVGCHVITADVGEGVVFPEALDTFQQVTEHMATIVDGQKRFRISPAMRDVFIPNRMQILRDFLVSGKAPEHSK